MKTLTFLRKIYREEKIKLIEPNNNLKKAYLEKSLSYIDSAKLLKNNNKIEESVSMIYYSMYYSLLALLFFVGIKCENHDASIILLKELFDIDNKDILKAKKERINKQYYVDFRININEVEELMDKTETFNDHIFNFIEKLNNNQINEIRKKVKRLLKTID